MNTFSCQKYILLGNSLAVQWLELCTFTAEGIGSISDRGTKIPQAVWHSQKKKKISFIASPEEFYSTSKMVLLLKSV